MTQKPQKSNKLINVFLTSTLVDINAESGKDPSVDVAGLRLLLNDSVFAKEFVPMVSHALTIL